MKPYLFAFTSIFLWASTASVIKLLLKNLNSLQILFFTSLFATIFLITVSAIRGTLSEVKQFRLKDFIWFAGMGFVGVFLYYTGLYLAIDYLSAQEAFIINYLWPIFIIIFAIPLLKEKFSVYTLTAIVLSFTGVIVVATRGDLSAVHFDSPAGVILAIMAAASYGLFSVLGKKREYDRFLSMGFYYLFTFFYVALTLMVTSGIPTIETKQIYGLLWIGIGTSGLAFTFWFLALKYGDTSKIAILAFLTPFLSLVYIHFLLDEDILPSSLIGLVLIMGGVLMQHFVPKKINRKAGA